MRFSIASVFEYTPGQAVIQLPRMWSMSRRQKNPLRPLTDEERTVLKQIWRAQSDPASHVARARALLQVADGSTYEAAAELVGRCCGDVVAQWVARFNVEGVGALEA